MRFIVDGPISRHSERAYVGDLKAIKDILITLCTICPLVEKCTDRRGYFDDRGIFHMEGRRAANSNCKLGATEVLVHDTFPGISE